ncbi:MAG: general secretion pathway protein GspK [Magnetococcales bacterium]|nr:general secretion pathway protein GspK [Magnetococcales bacterium]
MGRRGAALITALLIVASAVMIASGMVSLLQLEIRLAANIQDRDRAMHFALGGEAWAMGVLARDATAGSHDHLGEAWATVLPPMPVTGGTASGRILDLQGACRRMA